MNDEQKPGPDEKFCSSCGAIIKKEAEICPKCGVRISIQPGSDEMFCPSCGAVIKKAAEICPKCGVRVSKQKNNTVNFNPQSYPPGYVPKQKTTALLLCIFLGILGVHRFYTGKIGTGILMLLTLGGFGIWWLIDLVLICCDSFTDGQGYVLAKEGVPVNTSQNISQVEDVNEQQSEVAHSKPNGTASTFGIISIVLGVFGIVFAWFPIIQYFALAASIVGIVLSVLGIKEAHKSNVTEGLSIAGLIFCILAAVLSLTGVFICTACTSAAVKAAKETSSTMQDLDDAAKDLEDASNSLEKLKELGDSLKELQDAADSLKKITY